MRILRKEVAMGRCAWTIFLSLLLLVGCSRQSPPEGAKQEPANAKPGGASGDPGSQATADETKPFESFDTGDIEEEQPKELDADPTLNRPGHGAQAEAYDDANPVFEHKGGGAPASNKDMVGGGGFNVIAHGTGPQVAGAGGIGIGLGTGRNLGGGDGIGFGGRGHRKAMAAPAGGWRYTPGGDGATAMGLLPFLAAGRRSAQAGSPGALPEHIETWKPSRLVPNTSRLMVGDKEELPLRAIQVDVRIDGFRARVLLDLYYFNDRPRQLEGNFQLRLPEEASPYFFAFGRTAYQAPAIEPASPLFFKPQKLPKAGMAPEEILARYQESWIEPKVARVVTKEKAAQAYRETVRRRVDPALVEWAGAGVFQCRVFPLAPQALHRVVVGYDVDLIQAGDDLELRLDLPEKTPTSIVDLSVAAESERQVSLDAPATRSPAAPLSQREEGVTGGGRLSYHLVNPRERPLSVRLRKPGTVLLAGGDARTGPYFAARLRPEVPDAPAASAAKRAVFLLDASLTAAPQFPVWLKLLRAVLANNRGQIDQFAVLFFNIETFWWQHQFMPNTAENVETLMQYADGLVLEGASDLGSALTEAASPAWAKPDKAGGADRPDLFLLADGAATWGENEGPALARALRARGSGALWAYRSGASGSDPRLLAQLAEASGGAVFSLVGEAEIERASTAHRSRPWRLVAVESPGGRDLLLAGRPQTLFPHQQLLLVGRGRPDAQNPEIVLTLQQGDQTRHVRTKVDRVLDSDLAVRAYGQVAVGQLEDLVEPREEIAAAYARHFRVTGRTCSLLMLESEQDYARFHIRPEEDEFVVKDQPASAVVATALERSAQDGGDPKAAFLAWFRRLDHTPGLHFDLPASLGIALEGLPRESFVVPAEPLHCKVRRQEQLPAEVRKDLAAATPDYDRTTAEAHRRRARYGGDDALRALSSLVANQPGDAALARDVAFSAVEWGLGGHAYHLLRRAARTFEPQTYYAMAHCLEQAGRADLAIIYYELAYGGQEETRRDDLREVVGPDYRRFLRRVAEGWTKSTLADFAKARLATLGSAGHGDTADLAVIILWNTDGTDVDLHVTNPDGEECYYAHPQTRSGGHISRDVTTGYGPEMYFQPDAGPGTYYVRAHYFATDVNRASSRTKVCALIYQGWGTADEKVALTAISLDSRSDMVALGRVGIAAGSGDEPQPPKGSFRHFLPPALDGQY
jgi:hypothetical protein